MMMDLVSLEDVLRAVQMHGPLLPMDIKRILRKGDTITIGAVLSQLSYSRQILITKIKRGGSPFYYSPGQEQKLDRISENLNAKDKQTYELLKSEKVLRDSAQDPLTRVSLRQISDFSRTFTVTIDGKKEIFWRYFLINEPEAIRILKEIYSPKKKELKRDEKRTVVNKEAIQQKQGDVVRNESILKKEIAQKLTELQNIKKENESFAIRSKKVDSQKQLKNQIFNSGENSLKNTKIKKVEKENSLQGQRELTEEFTKKNLFETINDPFLDRIRTFFHENEIEIKEVELVRKGFDYSFIIELKTAFGRANYFCKAKAKKKSSAGDLSQAYVKGQIKRLPVVYLTTGEIVKNAKEKTKTDYKGMLIKEI